MARRDVDVVIGARTDDASFNRAQQRTDGFLRRLGGGKGDPLAVTSAASERMSKMVQAVALVEAGARTIDATFNLIVGLSARMRGDMEASADAFEKAYQTMRTAPVIGSVTGTIETIMGSTVFKKDMERVADLQDRMAKANANIAKNEAFQAKVLKERADAEQKLAQLREERWRAERLEGKEGFDLEIALIQERMQARKLELIAMQDVFATWKEQARFEKEWQQQQLLFEREIARVEERRREDAIQKIKAHMKLFFSFFSPAPDAPEATPSPVPFRASDPTTVSSSLLRGFRSDISQSKEAERVRLANQQLEEQRKGNGLLTQLINATKGQTAAPILN